MISPQFKVSALFGQFKSGAKKCKKMWLYWLKLQLTQLTHGGKAALTGLPPYY
jgi:hypothetical protein